jgi:uncharacterized membrane protein
MSEIYTEPTFAESTLDGLLFQGRVIFALAIIAIGIETLVVARHVSHVLGPQYSVLSVIPWLPTIPRYDYAFGVIWIVSAICLLYRHTVRPAAWVLGTLLFLCAIVLDVPKNAADVSNIALRTGVFEPLAIACLAWLIPGPRATPQWLTAVARSLLALSLIVFGVDHFLALKFIATLVPTWISWHVFWVAFFGAALIAAGLGIGLNILQRWAAAFIGLMFGVWVVTLHLPRVLALYGIPGAPRDPDEWSSLFIAIALWGGLWALAGVLTPREESDRESPGPIAPI